MNQKPSASHRKKRRSWLYVETLTLGILGFVVSHLIVLDLELRLGRELGLLVKLGIALTLILISKSVTSLGPLLLQTREHILSSARRFTTFLIFLASQFSLLRILTETGRLFGLDQTSILMYIALLAAGPLAGMLIGFLTAPPWALEATTSTYTRPLLKKSIVGYGLLLSLTNIPADAHNDAVLCFEEECQAAYDGGGRQALHMLYWRTLKALLKEIGLEKLEQLKQFVKVSKQTKTP